MLQDHLGEVHLFLSVQPLGHIIEGQQGGAIRIAAQHLVGHIEIARPVFPQGRKQAVHTTGDHHAILLFQFARIKGFQYFLARQKGGDIRFRMDHLRVRQARVVDAAGFIWQVAPPVTHQRGGFLIDVFQGRQTSHP